MISFSVKRISLVLFGAMVLAGCKSISKTTVNSTEVPTDKKWSERMALTLMKKYPEAYMLDDKTEPKWDYVHGLVMIGFEELYTKTKNPQYFNYVNK